MKETFLISGHGLVGSFNGALSTFSAIQLGSFAIKEAVRKANLQPESISEVIMGCVLQGGLGQAPARQASMGAGIPPSVSCMTVNKICGSGLKSAMIGMNGIKLGESEIVVAGGMESMSNAPYLLERARNGYRMGNGKIVDMMIHDGLWDPYGNVHMGNIGEMCAKEYKITREAQDEFAKNSYTKAQDAIKNGYLKEQIIGIEIKDKKGNATIIDEDEEP